MASLRVVVTVLLLLLCACALLAECSRPLHDHGHRGKEYWYRTTLSFADKNCNTRERFSKAVELTSRCMMGNVHVVNGSSQPIRARVSQRRVTVKEIEVAGKVTAPFSLEAKVKAALDDSLDVAGFTTIGPGESLEFDVDSLSPEEEYVTITTADEVAPRVICYNYNPPWGRSIIVTDLGTVQLSQRHGDRWRTDGGICYGPNCGLVKHAATH